MRHKKNFIRFDDHLSEMLRDSEFRKGYEELDEEFAVIEALLTYRREQGISQEWLASATGMKQSAIARLESGTGNPTLKSLFRLAEGLGARLEIKFVPKN